MQSDDELMDGDKLAPQGGPAREARGLLGPKKEADYDYFMRNIWPAISTKDERQTMTAPMVWQVCAALDMVPMVESMLRHDSFYNEANFSFEYCSVQQ